MTLQYFFVLILAVCVFDHHLVISLFLYQSNTGQVTQYST